MKKKRKLTVYVAEDLIRWMKHFAIEENTTVSELVKTAVDAFMQGKSLERGKGPVGVTLTPREEIEPEVV